jgi:hypothetical protein
MMRMKKIMTCESIDFSNPFKVLVLYFNIKHRNNRNSVFHNMKIQYVPENFVLIYQNSQWLFSLYTFIKVMPTRKLMAIPYVRGTYLMRERDQANVTGISVKATDGKKYMFENGSHAERNLSGNKNEWVKQAITYDRLFVKTCPYLYIHEGVYGFYDILSSEFTPFEDNVAAKNAVNEYFYLLMSMRDKPLNYQACEVNRCKPEPDVDRETNLENMINELENNDDEYQQESDSDDEETDSEPEKVVEKAVKISSNINTAITNPWKKSIDAEATQASSMKIGSDISIKLPEPPKPEPVAYRPPVSHSYNNRDNVRKNPEPALYSLNKEEPSWKRS